MVARVVTSFAHGSFFGIGAVVAASLVPAEKRASAIALMFTGLTLANVLGVPFGTFIGQEFGWRATFWIVAALGVLSLARRARRSCRTGMMPARSNLGREVRVLKEPQVWLALAMTVLGFGGVFVVFTYIAPILEQVERFLAAWRHAGAGAVRRRPDDRQYDRRQARGPRADAVADGHSGRARHRDGRLRDARATSQIAAVVTIFVWGIAAFATVPPLQTRVVEKAKHAPNLASTLNIGAFNVGNAGGAWLGGVVMQHGHALDSLPWVAAAVAIVALGVTWYASRLDARPTVTSAKPADA